MTHPVIHFEVTGKDGEALQRYYADLFGWTMHPVADFGYSLVDKVGDGIAGGIGAAQDGGDGLLTFYVQTDDPHATLDKAVELGVDRLVEHPEVMQGGHPGRLVDGQWPGAPGQGHAAV